MGKVTPFRDKIGATHPLLDFTVGIVRRDVIYIVYLQKYIHCTLGGSNVNEQSMKRDNVRHILSKSLNGW